MIRALALIMLIILSGCDREPEIHRGSILAFGTNIDVTFANIDAHKAIKARQELISLFDAMHRDWHAWRPGKLSNVNQAIASGNEIAIDDDMIHLVTIGQQLENQSEGLFNPAIGHLIALWGFHRDDPENGSTPNTKQLEELINQHPSMNDLKIDSGILRSSNPSVHIDMGGYAKGFGIDLALKRLQQLNINNAIVNAGGDLRVIGTHGSRAWRAGIKNPRGPGVIGTVELHDGEAIFTSGDYERHRQDQGHLIHHIIDPTTGYPSTSSVSATVIHDNGIVADAAATALMIARPDQWHRIAQKMGIRYVLLIDKNGDITMNPAMANRVELENIPASKVHISSPLKVL